MGLACRQGKGLQMLVVVTLIQSCNVKCVCDYVVVAPTNDAHLSFARVLKLASLGFIKVALG